MTVAGDPYDSNAVHDTIEVLVVDDDGPSRKLLTHAVDELKDVVPVSAARGGEAIERLREREFALILLDVSMPDMSGLDVVKWIREQDLESCPPIIIVTAFNKDDQSVATGYDLGVVDYIFKPLNLAHLQSKIQVFIDLHRQRKELERSHIVLQMQQLELSRSKERLVAMIKHMPNGVAMYEASGDGEDFILLDMNRAGEMMSRASIAKNRGKPLTEVFPGVAQMGLLNVFRRVWKTGRPEYIHEMCFTDKNGEEIWFENSVYKLPFGEMVAIFKDITDYKQALFSVSESEERLSMALDVVNEGIWDWRSDTGEVYFSPRYYTMLGYEENEFAPSFENFIDLVHPDDRERVTKTVSETVESGEGFDFEMRLRAKNNEFRWIRTRGRAVEFNAQGSTQRILGSHTDVTQEKQDKEELRKQRNSLALAQKIANMGSWERNVETGAGQWSDHMYRLFGYEPGEVEPGLDFLIQSILPEDRDQIDVAIEMAKNGADAFSVDYRIVTKDNEVRNIQSRGVVESSDDAGPVMHGILYDVTERVRAEENLRKNEEKYHTLYESIRDAILVANTDRLVVDCNPAFSELFGYTLDELEGKPTYIIYENDEEFKRVGELAKSVENSEESCFYTVNYRKKSGEIFFGETNIFTLKNVQGESFGYVGLIRDVSERIRAERELKESEERWRNLLQAVSIGVVVYDSDLNIIAHNTAACLLMGLRPTGSDGREAKESQWQFLRQDGEVLPKEEYPVNIAVNSGETLLNYTMGVVNPDTSSVNWVLVNATPIRLDDGTIAEIIVTCMDISENIRKEDQLKRRTYELEVLHKLSNRLGYTLDYNDVIRLLIENLSQVVDFDVAAGLVFHEESSKVFIQCSTEIGPTLRKDIVRRMFETANDFSDSGHLESLEAVQDVSCPLPDADSQVVDKVESSFIIPMFERHGGVAGVLYVGASKVDAFSADQIGIVFKVAEQVGHSMGTLRSLVDENIEEVSQVLTAIPSGVILMDSNYTIVMANPKGKEKLQLLTGKTAGDKISELGGMPIDEIMERVLAKEKEIYVEHSGTPRRLFQLQGQEIKTGPQAGKYVLNLYDITKERESAERIRASEERFRMLFDNASDAIFVIDPGGRIVDVNSVACTRLEYTREELLNMELDDIDALDSDQEFMGKLSGVLDAGFVHFETEHRRKGGTIVPIEINAKSIWYEGRQVILATARNITERKQAELEQAEHEATLNTILTGIRASFLICRSENMEVVEVNDQAAVLLDRSKEELLGMQCDELLSSSACQVPDSQPSEGEKAFFLGREFTLNRDDGTVIPVAISRLNLVRRGKSYVIVILFDISERKQLERQLAFAQKLESVGQLAAGIAHEINTPIQYVASNISFLDKAFEKLKTLIERYNKLHEALKVDSQVAQLVDELEASINKSKPEMLLEEIPEAIKDSQDGVDRVAKIVQAMKKFSHPDVEEMKQIDVNEAIRNTVTVARNEWKYDSKLNLELADDLPMIEGLPGDFNQAILNVLVNAAHANTEMVAEEGGKASISIHSALRDGFVEVRIKDEGPGIPKSHFNRIFDPFFTTKEVGKGTGQGLAITHTILDKHGGTISFESVEGEGTTFIMLFPVQQASKAGDA